MICPRCVARGAARSTIFRQHAMTSRRSFALSSSVQSTQQPISTNTAATSNPQRDPPAATSTSAAQPFSTPETYGPGIEGTSTQPKKNPVPARPKSSVPAGTPLKGLNYFKGKQDPVALEDEEYPDWLWTVLDEKKSADSGAVIENDPRIYSKSANARRKANKQLRKAMASISADTVTKVPLYEQTVDLPRTEGDADSARHELARAMREQRRKGIKEANFLQTMR